MPESDLPAGWAWFDRSREAARVPDELCRDAAGCLDSRHGQALLRHLQQLFLDRRLPPTATDAELRHVEGQRSVVSHILRLVERGHSDATPLPLSKP